MAMEITPKSERVATTGVVHTHVVHVPRCAAKTKRGTQCTNILNGGEGGGWMEIDGERVPLCTVHFTSSRRGGAYR